ncbi:hypothetical protein B0J11DRAFT_54888 [Dendryphion nanum]|uniref:Uncharacterized protein n=1 Tax=Dendryphion nanum TaxID=256645 RepID=A0A9P9DI26_9PLEO|nr:hypothetical protein B0J11DRAFT_54888 [Dendryphion nanum]
MLFCFRPRLRCMSPLLSFFSKIWRARPFQVPTVWPAPCIEAPADTVDSTDSVDSVSRRASPASTPPLLVVSSNQFVCCGLFPARSPHPTLSALTALSPCPHGTTQLHSTAHVRCLIRVLKSLCESNALGLGALANQPNIGVKRVEVV